MNKKVLIGVVVVGLIVIAAVTIFFLKGAKKDTKTDVSQSSNPTSTQENSASGSPVNSKVKIDEIKLGTGPEAKAGDTVSVNYLGTLTNGTKFDSSYDRNKPFEFKIGTGQVIKGWDQGIAGMKKGGKRKLTIPPELGYGAQNMGSIIPANSTLVFEVELLEIK